MEDNMKLENIKLNLDTQIVYNVGDPIARTNAPRVYNKLFEALDMNAIMLPVQIPKGGLPQFLEACRTLNIRYICPTMPHKADIIPLLDDVEEASRIFRSVNAVKIDADGTSHGIGLDGKGAVGALLSVGIDLAGKKALLYGAGGISGAIAYELARRGAAQISIANRTLEKAEQVAEMLGKHFRLNAKALVCSQAALDQEAADTDIVLQLTPLGMAGYGQKHDYLGFIQKLPGHAAVMDAVINPPGTDMLQAARARGLRTVAGMDMLVSQMDEIFAFLFGRTLSEANRQACIEELRSFLHIK